MLHVRRQQSSRLCAAVEPVALLLATTTPTKSSGWRGKQRESRRHSGQPRILMGARVAAAQIGVDAPTALRARAHAAAAKTGVDTPAVLPGDGVDGDRGIYRQRDSPSPDRYHGRRMAQAIVRDIGPGGGWPTLTKTNYVEWAAVMRVRLQVRHMWEAVRYGDVDYHEDRQALDALIAAVPPEMQFSLSQKRTAKEAWDAIATRIGSDRARKTTLQAFRKEWENLAFKPGEDVDDFALRLNTVAEDGAVRRRHLR
jgi:hypothetical protein